MKLAFVSDLHLGYDADALPQARAALLAAAAAGAGAVLLPGDLFDERVPRPETVFESVKLFKEAKAAGKAPVAMRQHVGKDAHSLAWAGLPLIAISGTHERRSKGMANVIVILAEAGLLINLHGKTLELEKDGERVAVQGMQGVPEDYFRATLGAANYKPVQGAYNIFMFHQSLSELLPYEREDFVSLQELPAGFDVYLDGHIHWRVDLTQNGRRLLVPGSTVITQQRKREEEGKGFWLFDSKTQEATFHFIDSRPFHLVGLEFHGANARHVKEKLEEALRGVMEKSAGREPAVRAVLSGTLEKGLLPSAVELEAVERAWAGKMRLYVEKEFDSSELKDKILQLRRLRQEQKGAKELGMELLRARLKDNGLQLKDEDALFELLSEGELEKAEELL